MGRPASPTAHEAALVERLRAGDRAAFEGLIRAYGGKLLAVARRILRDDDEAEDAVQDAFLSAFRSLDGFRGQSELGTWLHRIAINAALMKLRARNRRPEAEIDDLLPQFMERGHHAVSPARWADPPEDDLARAEICRAVRAKIDELPENYRIPLILRDIEGLTTAEVAEQLGTTINAAKIRVHRARQALRTLLNPRLAEDAP